MTYANNLVPDWAKWFVVKKRSADGAICISFFETPNDLATFIPGSKTLPRPVIELESVFAQDVPADRVDSGGFPKDDDCEALRSTIENLQDDYDNLRADYNGLLSKIEKLKTFGAAVCLGLPDAITPTQGAFMRLLLTVR